MLQIKVMHNFQDVEAESDNRGSRWLLIFSVSSSDQGLCGDFACGKDTGEIMIIRLQKSSRTTKVGSNSYL